MKLINKEGQKFGMLTIIKHYSERVSPYKCRSYVDCVCDCGKSTSRTTTEAITSGHTRSCGCVRLQFKDREKAKRMRSSWSAMHRRCSSTEPSHKKYYADKGIAVCSEWKTFPGFYADMHESWAVGMTIERIDNDKGYSKNNCEWATKTNQQRHKSNLKLNLEGAEFIRNSKAGNRSLAAAFGVDCSTISRVKRGKRWSMLDTDI